MGHLSFNDQQTGTLRRHLAPQIAHPSCVDQTTAATTTLVVRSAAVAGTGATVVAAVIRQDVVIQDVVEGRPARLSEVQGGEDGKLAVAEPLQFRLQIIHAAVPAVDTRAEIQFGAGAEAQAPRALGLRDAACDEVLGELRGGHGGVPPCHFTDRTLDAGKHLLADGQCLGKGLRVGVA